MAQLCNRCELLFQECRPLAGAVCGAPGAPTGWPPGLLQDDNRGLSKWLSNTPHARLHVRQVAAAVVEDHRTGEVHLVPVLAVDLDTEPKP